MAFFLCFVFINIKLDLVNISVLFLFTRFPVFPKSIEHLVVNNHKPRNFTQSQSAFSSFYPQQTFVLTVSFVLLQYFDHYLFLCILILTHFLFLNLFVILIALTLSCVSYIVWLVLFTSKTCLLNAVEI